MEYFISKIGEPYRVKDNHTNLVSTKTKSITELDYFLNNTILRDLYSLNSFWCSVGIEMKGGKN
jgi:hypothetical protein